jgi:outer membrane immunogenic protein
MNIRTLLVASSAFCAGPALAADLTPYPAEPAAPAAVYLPFSWTGFYAGAHVGYGFSTVDSNLAAPLDSFDMNGVVGGLHAGYNYQMNQFVLGVEGDVDLTSISGRSDPLAGVTTKFSVPWQGSVRGRLGYAWDRFLLYGTGGVAFADAKLAGGNSKGLVGWTLGAGLEYAFTDSLSGRVEYRYTDFQRATFTAPATGSFKSGFNENQVLVGISYKF